MQKLILLFVSACLVFHTSMGQDFQIDYTMITKLEKLHDQKHWIQFCKELRFQNHLEKTDSLNQAEAFRPSKHSPKSELYEKDFTPAINEICKVILATQKDKVGKINLNILQEPELETKHAPTNSKMQQRNNKNGRKINKNKLDKIISNMISNSKIIQDLKSVNIAGHLDKISLTKHHKPSNKRVGLVHQIEKTYDLNFDAGKLDKTTENQKPGPTNEEEVQAIEQTNDLNLDARKLDKTIENHRSTNDIKETRPNEPTSNSNPVVGIPENLKPTNEEKGTQSTEPASNLNPDGRTKRHRRFAGLVPFMMMAGAAATDPAERPVGLRGLPKDPLSSMVGTMFGLPPGTKDVGDRLKHMMKHNPSLMFNSMYNGWGMMGPAGGEGGAAATGGGGEAGFNPFVLQNMLNWARYENYRRNYMNNNNYIDGYNNYRPGYNSNYPNQAAYNNGKRIIYENGGGYVPPAPVGLPQNNGPVMVGAPTVLPAPVPQNNGPVMVGAPTVLPVPVPQNNGPVMVGDPTVTI